MADILEVRLPDIGDFHDVPVIEIRVKPGDAVRAEDPLVTLESDKAVMDVPSPAAGTVAEIRVKVGDRVSEGSVILTMASASATPAAAPEMAPPAAAQASPAVAAPVAEGEVCELRPSGDEPMARPAPISMPTPAAAVAETPGGPRPHASPSVRRFARELGVDVAHVEASGPKGRILREDVQAFVKERVGAAAAAPPSAPRVDFARFGPVESLPLSRIQRISGANLARNWAAIPHVTQFDEADITEIEAFRIEINRERAQAGVKLTLLAFAIKAAVAALSEFPRFNASLDGQGDEMCLILKRYFHIGFAADTPGGLVVPVIRDVDCKGLLDIARETAALAAKAREGRLAPAEMQGGCFTVSSLGGIGGMAFTPIVNAPEVAILGVSRAATKPRWNGREFEPRLMLPLSLSYDHRVIDGAMAARFTASLAQALADMRRALL